MKATSSLTRALSLSLCLLASGCASVDVLVDFDPRADFASYRTFSWLTASATAGRDRLDQPLLNGQIRAAIERELLAKGFTKVSTGQPDFKVGHHLSLEVRVERESFDRRFGHAPHWHPDGYPFGYPARFELGTLVLDVIDARANRLAWRGFAPGRLPPPHARDESDRIGAAIAEVLSGFPPD